MCFCITNKKSRINHPVSITYHIVLLFDKARQIGFQQNTYHNYRENIPDMSWDQEKKTGTSQNIQLYFPLTNTT